jgi:membrane protein
MPTPRPASAYKRDWGSAPPPRAPQPEPETAWGRLVHFVSRGVWLCNLNELPPLKRFSYKSLRVLSLTLRGFVRDRCLFRAQALTFITTMSIVPLLAFIFSVSKGLGIYERLERDLIIPFLDSNMGPALEGGDVGLRNTIDRVLAMVNQTDFAGLGLFGLGILLYTVIKLLSAIEGSFNEIWGVDAPRSLPRKVADYLSILVVVPIMLILATGMSAALKNAEAFVAIQDFLHLGPVVTYLVSFGSFFSAWFSFAFVYLFMPNTKVRLFSALVGGLCGSVLWGIAQILYVQLQFGVANQSAIYASVAAIPIFLVWVNASWITVLMGAELAFAHQNEPAFSQIARSREEDQAFRERVALRALTRLAGAFDHGESLPSVPALATEIGIPERSLEFVLVALAQAGQLTRVQGQSRVYTFTTSPDHLRVKMVLDALKGRRSQGRLEAQSPLDSRLEGLLDAFEEEQSKSIHNKTIRELATQ